MKLKMKTKTVSRGRRPSLDIFINYSDVSSIEQLGLFLLLIYGVKVYPTPLPPPSILPRFQTIPEVTIHAFGLGT